MKLKEAMKKAKETGQAQKVTEAANPNEKRDIKVNISIRLDFEVLDWLKSQAEVLGMPYQTFINTILHTTMVQNKNPMRFLEGPQESELEKRIEAMEIKFNTLKQA